MSGLLLCHDYPLISPHVSHIQEIRSFRSFGLKTNMKSALYAHTFLSFTFVHFVFAPVHKQSFMFPEGERIDGFSVSSNSLIIYMYYISLGLFLLR